MSNFRLAIRFIMSLKEDNTMAYVYFNANPCKKIVGDCVIRAISKAMDIPWTNVYADLCLYGMEKCDIPSSNSLWGAYLKDNGYKVVPLSSNCPDCYTVRQFTEDHPIGNYILATGNHAVASINGDYFDSFDSGDEVIAYYFERKE